MVPVDSYRAIVKPSLPDKLPNALRDRFRLLVRPIDVNIL
jgi:hypothetical protein